MYTDGIYIYFSHMNILIHALMHTYTNTNTHYSYSDTNENRHNKCDTALIHSAFN